MSDVRAVIQEMMNKIVITDERQQAKVVYPLLPTVIAIIICWCSGCKNCVEVADYWSMHLNNLARIIPGFPQQAISHDTINRLLRIIKFEELNKFLSDFCQKLIEADKLHSESGQSRRILSLDGQTPKAMEYEPKKDSNGQVNADRRTYNRTYYVTLQDTTNKISMAQDEVKNKENENKACERLIDLFSLDDCVVTADALNTQRGLAAKIIAKNGDYCLALKDNHKSLCKAVREVFEQYGDEALSYETDYEKEQGRLEKRTVLALPVTLVKKRVLGEWAQDANTIFLAITESKIQKYGQQREKEVRLFISSLDFDTPNIAQLGYEAIRRHWGIENSLHWVLDMDYHQDLSQMKNRNFIRNKLVMNKISLNIVRLVQKKLSRASETVSVRRTLKMISYNPSLAIEGMKSYFLANGGKII